MSMDAQEVAASVRDRRSTHYLTIEQAASEPGVAPTTLHRVESSEHVRDY